MSRAKILLTCMGLAALVATSIAAASHRQLQTSDVAATFMANATNLKTRTCTVGANTFRVTRGTWRGTSTSAEARLAGNLVIRGHSVLNVTTGDGWFAGKWHSRNPAGGRANAGLSAVIDNANHLDGLAAGTVHAPGARLLGNWSATTVGETLSGNLGSNAPVAPDNSALLFRGGCPHKR